MTDRIREQIAHLRTQRPTNLNLDGTFARESLADFQDEYDKAADSLEALLEVKEAAQSWVEAPYWSEHCRRKNKTAKAIAKVEEL